MGMSKVWKLWELCYFWFFLLKFMSVLVNIGKILLVSLILKENGIGLLIIKCCVWIFIVVFFFFEKGLVRFFWGRCLVF